MSTRRELIAEGLVRVDRNDVSGACRICLRIAREAKDLMSATMFLREVSPTKQLFMDAFFSIAKDLNEEARKFLHDKSLERWVLQRDIENGKKLEAESIYLSSIGEMEAEREQFKQHLADGYSVPPGMHPEDTAMFEDRTREAHAVLRPHIKLMTRLIERSKARCYNFLLQMEVIDGVQQDQNTTYEGIVIDVLGYFKNEDNGVYEKLVSISQSSLKKDAESRSLLLTGIRRAYKSVVDHFYPPVAGKTMCADGVERDLGEERFVNRAREYVRTRAKGTTLSEIVTAHVEHMDRIATKLNDLASKGVHGEVDQKEATQCVITFYGFVQSLISLKLNF